MDTIYRIKMACRRRVGRAVNSRVQRFSRYLLFMMLLHKRGRRQIAMAKLIANSVVVDSDILGDFTFGISTWISKLLPIIWFFAYSAIVDVDYGVQICATLFFQVS